MQVEVTMTSAPASDAMKMFVVERMPRLMITDTITREFPNVPKKIANMFAMDNPTTALKLAPLLLSEFLYPVKLLVKFVSSGVLFRK